MNDKEISLQEYLSLGYLYLVVLGIVSDVIYYKFLGINILTYSTILDILISPINILTRNGFTFLAFFAVLLTVYILLKYVNPYLEARKRRKAGIEKKEYEEKPEPNFIFLFLIGILSMFLGFGLGSGSKRSDAMEAGKAEPTHHITFSDETEVDAKVMGQNTAFIFFVVEGERVVTAAPLTGNVKWVRRMEKTDEDE